MRTRRLARLVAPLVVLVAAAPARAATVSISGNGKSKVLQYEAAVGEPNVVAINEPTFSGQFQIFDSGQSVHVSAGAGCTVDAVQPESVDCPTQGVTSVVVNLGDGDDSATTNGVSLPLTINGGDGNDSLTEGPLHQQIKGGLGDDYLDAGSYLHGADTWSGGSGHDTIQFPRFDPPALSNDGRANDGLAGENDNIGTDIDGITGGYSDDTITGGPGDDTLFGKMGNTSLSGAGGNDVLDVHYGECRGTVDGGDCKDQIITSGGATVTAGPGDDTIAMYGGCSAGDDVSGGSGVDTYDLSGDSDSQIVSLDDLANDGWLNFATQTGNVHSDIERLIGSSRDDVLIGSSHAESLDGGPGDDIHDGGGGADLLEGGAGTDIADYSARTAPVTADLTGSPGNDGETAEGDTIASDVEGIWGGSGNDKFTGGPGDNIFDGGLGA